MMAGYKIIRDVSRSHVGDLIGGLTGMAVALPQSMGLGIVLFASMGFGVSSGALAGLIGAATISLVSGIGGNTRGMISAPNGPVTMLLVATLASVCATGVQGADLLSVLAILLVLAGALQVLLGVTGGGQLVKYIPYPTLTGLVTAIGILMIESQLANIFGGSDGLSSLVSALGILMVESQKSSFAGGTEILSEIAWLLVPAATTALTLLGINFGPRWLPKIPGIVSGLVVGMVSFHLIMAVVPGPVPRAWIVGSIPSLEASALNLNLSALGSFPWQLIIASALALAVLASIDCLVTAVVADAATGSRHNGGRELVAQGIGQIAAGLLGGCGGGGTKGSTLTAIHSGGRRRPAVFAGLMFVVLILFLGRLGEYLPISVLAGVIIHVGFHMLEWRIISWLQTKKARIDGILALIVVGATLTFDLMTGVGVGVLSAAVLFIRSQSRATVIHERTTGRERRALRHRSKKENTLLDKHGDQILCIELRGHLFFGTVDRLFTELLPDLKRPAWIILNMRRVQSLDMSGLNLLHKMMILINAHGGHLLFANLFTSIAQDRKMKKLLHLLDPGDRDFNAKTFRSTDKALEFAENGLLTQVNGHAPTGSAERVEPEDNDLCKAMRPRISRALRDILRPVTFRRKARVFTAGQEDNALYLVLHGEVDIRIPTSKYHYKRLKRVGPGGFFGEMSFLNPGPRVTTAVAMQNVELMVLEHPNTRALSDPLINEAIQSLQRGLGYDLAARMRWASTEICRLERW